MAGQHAGAEHEHRVVQRRTFALLNGVQSPGDVGHLFQEELIDFQPVVRIGVGQQVVDHVIDAQMRETQRAVVVVQLQGADASGIGLKGQDQDVAHQSHVFDDVLRVSVLRSRHVGTGQRRAPALQLASLAGLVQPLFEFAHGIQILVQPLLIGAADVAAEVPASSSTSSKTLLSPRCTESLNN
jgi:hypothetical protein